MSALARSSIRARIAEAVTTTLGPAGWTESPWHVDLVGSDPQSSVHLSFAAGILATAPVQLDRQRPSVGAVGTTGVLIRFVHRCRADSQVTDYDDALTAGEALVAAVVALDKDPGLSVRLVGYRGQQLAGDGTYLLSDVEFSVLHRLGLS